MAREHAGHPFTHFQFLAADAHDKVDATLTTVRTDTDFTTGEPVPPAETSNRSPKKEKRRRANIKFATMREAFAPIAALLLIKFLDMELASALADKFKRCASCPRNQPFEAWCEEGGLRE